MTYAIPLLAAHMLGDFAFQAHAQAMGKRTSLVTRLQHVAIYTLCFAPFMIALADGTVHGAYRASFFLLAIFLPHLLIDSFVWARKDHPWPLKSLFVDQSLHVLHLAIVSTAFSL
jgi:hypothetical protein